MVLTNSSVIMLLPPIWWEHLLSVSVLVSVIPPDSSDGIVLFGNF